MHRYREFPGSPKPLELTGSSDMMLHRDVSHIARVVPAAGTDRYIRLKFTGTQPESQPRYLEYLVLRTDDAFSTSSTLPQLNVHLLNSLSGALSETRLPGAIPAGWLYVRAGGGWCVPRQAAHLSGPVTQPGSASIDSL